jgi:flagellar motor switch protein FliN/FliY
MQGPDVTEVWKSVAQRFSDALTGALDGACEVKWKARPAGEPAGAPPDGSSAAAFRCTFEGSCAGEAILVVPHAAKAELRLRNIPEDDWDKQKAQTTRLLSALEGCMAGLAESLDEDGAISARIELLEGFALKDERVVELLLEGADGNEGGTAMSLHLCLSQALLATLQGAMQRASSAKPFVFPEAAGGGDRNLGLVMDVELNVTLRFGQRQLALREVLELTSGSVVELDRQVDEPVELVLDGRVVARGEAVIIDGNYGMRITQLMQNMLP